MPEVIRVGMADFKIGRAPDKLVSYGLGSCIGISLYDPQLKIGGLLHIMLPDSTQSRARSNRAKFADTGIPDMLDEMLRMGCSKDRLVAKIAGGSQMFSFANASDMMRIGTRNVANAKEVLAKLFIPLVGEDTGGDYGRTVEFDLSTGSYKVKTINHGVVEL